MPAGDAVTLMGFYDAHNAGDDLLCHIFADALRKRGHERIYLPRATPELRTAVGATPIKDLDTAIRQSRFVVVGGGGGLAQGGLRRGLSRQPLSNAWNLAWKCWWHRKPMYMLGIGVGPLPTPAFEKRARKIASMAKLVVVRDAVSYRTLLGLDPRLEPKARLLADPAYAVDYDGLRAGQSPAPGSLGVNLCQIPAFQQGLSPDKAVSEVIAAVRELVGAGRVKSVTWFSTNRSGAELLWACRAYRAIRDSRLVFYDDDPMGWIREMATCESFLSMKLHSAVFAAGMGLSLMGIGYHPKIQRFYDRVGAAAVYRGLDTFQPGQIGHFIAEMFPGARGISSSPGWQELRRLGQAVFEEIPRA